MENSTSINDLKKPKKIYLIILFSILFIAIVTISIVKFLEIREKEKYKYFPVNHVPGELIIDFKEEVAREEAINLLKEFGCKSAGNFGFTTTIPSFTCNFGDIDDKELNEQLKKIEKNKNVEFVTINSISTAF